MDDVEELKLWALGKIIYMPMDVNDAPADAESLRNHISQSFLEFFFEDFV